MKLSDGNKSALAGLGAMACFILVFVAFCGSAKADVVTCTSGPAPAGSACALPSSKPRAQLIGADFILWCGSGAYPPKGGAANTCTGSMWMPWAQMQSSNFVLTDNGWYRLNDTGFPPDGQAPLPPVTQPAYVPYKYQCPGNPIIAIGWDVEGSAAVAVGYCHLPHQIRTEHFCGNPANLPKWLNNFMATKFSTWEKLVAWLGIEAQANVSRECTADEKALLAAVDAKNRPVITVRKSGAALDRPVYTRKDDGTQGAEIKGLRAPIGAPCETSRLTAAGKPTDYFYYKGGYTLCDVK